LRALETTAKQKLIDFSDFLKIVSDSTLDKTFRHQAEEMAGKLFISEKLNTINLSNPSAGPNITKIEKFQQGGILKEFSCSILSDQISIKTPLTYANDSTYIGSLTFNQKCKSSGNSKQKGIFTQTIDIYAIKILKSFGKEQLPIWEIFLGNIIQNP
jgi:hypothetical protein